MLGFKYTPRFQNNISVKYISVDKTTLCTADVRNKLFIWCDSLTIIIKKNKLTISKPSNDQYCIQATESNVL